VVSCRIPVRKALSRSSVVGDCGDARGTSAAARTARRTIEPESFMGMVVAGVGMRLSYPTRSTPDERAIGAGEFHYTIPVEHIH
jgi:hypothetical protein